MGSNDTEPLQALESSSIDELWRMSSLPRGSDSPDLFYNAEDSIPNAYCSQEQTSEGLELSHICIDGQNLEPYFLAGGSIRIPEAASVAFIGSVVKEGRAASESPDVVARESISCVQTKPTVKLHTNELFKRKQGLGASSPSALVPIHLKFEDIRYKIVSRTMASKVSSDKRTCWGTKQRQQQAAPEKYILSGVSGSVAPGEILAMMGPSGCGKTTMLNILGGRILHEKFIGKVSYSGLPYSSALKRRIGYVTQDDILFPILTVRETLVFAALLRLSHKMSHREKIERAETVLRELGLERCQNTIVGGPFVPGVSGGERKRTSIGYELLVEPSLLLLDEPTSGLDSSTAFRILQLLRINAQMGRVIVTTIHQPSSRMFPVFDKLILLSEGHPMYFGAAKDATDYFASLQFVPLLTMNPFDFLVDLASGLTSDITLPPELSNDSTAISKRDDDCDQSNHVCMVKSETQQEFHKSAAKLPNSELTEDEYHQQMVVKFIRLKYRNNLEPKAKEKLHSEEDLTREQLTAMKTKKQWSASWSEQFIILCRRNCKERRRDYLGVLRFGQGIAVAILLGMLWWRTKLETEQGIRDQVGLLFYISIFWCTFSMWSTLNVFPMEKNYLVKERAADMYRLSAYYMSSTLCDLVAELIHPTLFIALVYFMTGLKSDFLTFSFTLLSVYLVAITAQAFGEFFGAATLDVKKVGIVSSMTMLIFLLAGGYYVQNIPVFLRWIRYVSIVYYGFNLLQRVQYSPDQSYGCHESGGCQRLDKSPIFGHIDLDGGLQDALALIGMVVVYKFLAYLCLRRVWKCPQSIRPSKVDSWRS